MRVMVLTAIVLGILASADGDAPFRFSTQGSKEKITTRGDWRDDDLTRVPPRSRPVPGPALVETRVFDTSICLDPSRMTSFLAYIHFCLDPVEECPDDQLLEPARESRSRPAGTSA